MPTPPLDPQEEARRISTWQRLGRRRNAAAAELGISPNTLDHTIERWSRRREQPPRTHLVIPDAHATPGVSNARFEWLGRLVVDLRPDVIIDLGDWSDMPSLCLYDREVKRREFIGRSYKEDVAVARDALERFEAPLLDHNAKRQKPFRPRKVKLYGNHDFRIQRALLADPVQLDGLISLQDLGAEEWGWEVHDFLKMVEIDGILYSHYFTSGPMGRPIAGKHHAANLVAKTLMSATCGHSHARDFKTVTRADGRKVHGLVAGCYFEHFMDYAGQANADVWRGVVIKRNVRDGDYDPEFLSLEAIRKRYG